MTKEEFRKQTEEAKFEAFSLMCEKVAELKAELAKRTEQIEALNKDKDYFSDALDRQIEATYKVVEKLNRAKEVITALLCIPHDMTYEELNSGSWDIVYKAEEFLKEE